MSRTLRRCARGLAAALAACGLVVVAAPAASADPKIPFTQDIYARTHLAKSGLDITVPPGEFNGTVDLATGEETGTLTLPPATVTINLFGLIPTADASFVMDPAGPVTGRVNLATFEVDSTASFNVRLAELKPHGTDLNLVGDKCTTIEPITVRMQGVVNPLTGGTFASTYSIPYFRDCGLLTPVISALVSGPGNTFVATFAPHGSPPPPEATGSTPTPASPLATVDVHGGVTAGGATLPIGRHVEVPGSSTPPLLTATPTPTTTTGPSLPGVPVAPPALPAPALPAPALPAPPAVPAPPVAVPPAAPPVAAPATPPPAGTLGGLLGSLLGGG